MGPEGKGLQARQNKFHLWFYIQLVGRFWCFVAKSIPKPSFLDQMQPLGAFDGEKRWRSFDGRRLYTWDALHGEIEVFDARGRHLGAVDAVTGAPVKEAVRGRRINV